MLDHPQSHLVGDHVAAFWYFLIVLKGTGNDLDKIGFCGVWQRESPVSEEIAGRVDVVFDGVGSNSNAGNGFSLDEGDGVASLGWKLPQVIPDYPSVTLYYPFFRGNVITQI